MKIVPVDCKKIVFSSFGGERISCNPYYIYKELKKDYDNFSLYWISNNKNIVIKEKYQLKYGTLRYIYHMLTASCVITNDTLPSYLPFRKKQLVINTWHGGGLFKQTYGYCSEVEKNYNERINKIHNIDTKLYTLSGEAWYRQVVNKRFGYFGKVLKCGMPRNDIFFNDSMKQAEIIVKKHYGISMSDSIVLYAPTFRGSSVSAIKKDSFHPVDVKEVTRALEKKFNKKFHFIFRGHHAMKTSLDGCIDASSYPDMQELLASADVFISDYSSCLWDYALTNKPIFLYAPDLEEYAIKPGFESDYKKWPFIMAQSNNELVKKIEGFDYDSFYQNIKCYLDDYGSYEKGSASKQVVDYIITYIRDNYDYTTTN